MISVFDIGKEYQYLDDFMNEINAETGEFVNSEDDLKSLLEEIEGKKTQKLDNIEYLKREKKGQLSTISEEIKRLQNKKKTLDNGVIKLNELQSILLGGEKLKTDKFSFSYRTTVSLKVPDEVDKVDSEWVKATYSWDKKKIKEDIQTSGIDYSDEGFELIEKTSLSVR